MGNALLKLTGVPWKRKRQVFGELQMFLFLKLCHKIGEKKSKVFEHLCSNLATEFSFAITPPHQLLSGSRRTSSGFCILSLLVFSSFSPLHSLPPPPPPALPPSFLPYPPSRSGCQFPEGGKPGLEVLGFPSRKSGCSSGV